MNITIASILVPILVCLVGLLLICIGKDHPRTLKVGFIMFTVGLVFVTWANAHAGHVHAGITLQ